MGELTGIDALDDDNYYYVAKDALALLNAWDENMWEKGRGRRVVDPDLADLYRRLRRLDSFLNPASDPVNQPENIR